jgi:membrane fusion protein
VPKSALDYKSEPAERIAEHEASDACQQQPEGQACEEMRPPGQLAHIAPSAIEESPRLFRTEALAERQTQWLGTVVLAPRASHHFVTLFVVLVVAAVAALLFFAEFTRKAKVSGWLVPQQGMVRVFAPRPGVITGLYVKEGQEVHKGDRLLTLSAELESATIGATQAEIARRLIARRHSLVEERSQHERLLAQRQRAIAERLLALRSEQAQLEREIALLKSREAIAERAVQLHRELRDQGFVSEVKVQQVEAERLEQAARLGAMERQRITLQRERLTLEGEQGELPLKAATEIGSIGRNISVLEQELAGAEAQREIVVPAPQHGTVTAILAELGGNANVATSLLSIVPAGASLEAHLYGPSRAVGFVRPGQRVLLRYQAYPYQKFGHHEGVVASVSRSAVSPGELPLQLAGVMGAPGANASEAVYRITVKLASQTVTAYGQQVPLQPGMQLEADVTLETRRLFEWLLDPLHSITGKWQG